MLYKSQIKIRLTFLWHWGVKVLQILWASVLGSKASFAKTGACFSLSLWYGKSVRAQRWEEQLLKVRPGVARASRPIRKLSSEMPGVGGVVWVPQGWSSQQLLVWLFVSIRAEAKYKPELYHLDATVKTPTLAASHFPRVNNKKRPRKCKHGFFSHPKLTWRGKYLIFIGTFWFLF